MARGECRQAAGERGVSTLEALLALALTTLLGMALLSLTRQLVAFQKKHEALIRKEQTLQVVPSLFLRTLSASGNEVDRELGIEVGSRISSRSDTDGRNGFPDGRLRHSFESIRMRALAGNLQLASGRGGFQSVSEGISELGAARLDAQLISVSVTGITAVVPGVGHSVSGEKSELLLWLWNYRSNLFGGEDR